MARLKHLFAGSAGNEQLTVMVATGLLLLLAIEGATLFRISSLLTVHAFVGMLLIPVVALKLVSAGWRLLRYYLGDEEYVRRGPPHVVLRLVVAPVLVLTTLVLFATGAALLALGQTGGTVVELHKASFIVWFGAAGLHVLVHVFRLPSVLRARIPGFPLRVALCTAAILGGALLAIATLPSADRLQDRATAHIGFDEH